MNYFKIIDENKLVGVGTSRDLLRYQKKHNIFVFATENEAEFIEIHGSRYHAKWMRPSEVECEESEIVAIGVDEYNEISALIAKGEEISVEADTESAPVIEEEPAEPLGTEVEEITVEFARSIKLKELSLACNKAITDGFDLDGKHYSLSLQDQANLNAAAVALLNGDTEVIYHADGDEYTEYSASDMLVVIQVANLHKLRNLAYFGCLKSWVNSLVQIKKIQDIEYGVEIPKRYQSSVYKSIVG